MDIIFFNFILKYSKIKLKLLKLLIIIMVSIYEEELVSDDDDEKYTKEDLNDDEFDDDLLSDDLENDLDDEEKKEEVSDDDLTDDDDDDLSDDDEETLNFKNGEMLLREKKITIPILTKYERTKILSFRSQQITENSPVLIDLEKMTLPLTPYNIALEELKQQKIPFKIKRKLPDNTYEVWKITEFKKIFL